jgi:hypothetical protein
MAAFAIDERSLKDQRAENDLEAAFELGGVVLH